MRNHHHWQTNTNTMHEKYRNQCAAMNNQIEGTICEDGVENMIWMLKQLWHIHIVPHQINIKNLKSVLCTFQSSKS